MKKLKKHTLRAERNMVCALCAAVFLVFAGAALAGWLAAPFPVGAVLTGVAAFVLVFTGILSGSWIKYAKRFYALATSPDYPTAIIGEGLTVTFCAVSPEKAAAYLREGAALAPLPKRYTREQWSERSDTAKDSGVGNSLRIPERARPDSRASRRSPSSLRESAENTLRLSIRRTFWNPPACGGKSYTKSPRTTPTWN